MKIEVNKNTVYLVKPEEINAGHIDSLIENAKIDVDNIDVIKLHERIRHMFVSKMITVCRVSSVKHEFQYIYKSQYISLDTLDESVNPGNLVEIHHKTNPEGITETKIERILDYHLMDSDKIIEVEI